MCFLLLFLVSFVVVFLLVYLNQCLMYLGWPQAYYGTNDDPEFLTLLPPLSGCYGYRHMPPYLAYPVMETEPRTL